VSQQNVEVVRAALEAWSRGEWDAALRETAPDVVFDNSTAIGEWRGVHRGAEEIRRMWERVTEPWEKIEMEITEVIEAREDLVVASTRARFLGRDGIELPGPTRPGWVFRFRDGKLVRVEFFNGLDDALVAAGLPK
jgi:ketosteroid isomerase-like protein